MSGLAEDQTVSKRFGYLLLSLALFIGACGSDTGTTTNAGDVDGGESSGDETPAAMPLADEADAAFETTPLAVAEGERGPLGSLLLTNTLDPGGVTSARFEGRLTISGEADSDLPGVVELLIDGAYDLPSDSSMISMDMSEIFQAASEAGNDQIPPGFEGLFSSPIEVVTIGEEGWMRWSVISMFTGGSPDSWIVLDPQDVDSATEGFGLSSSAGDPMNLLGGLAEADATVEDLGNDMVRGVASRHWRALIDLDTLSVDAEPAERAELETRFGDLGETEFPIDVWVGIDDGLVYRFVLDLSSEAFFEEAEDALSSTMSFEFYDYGADVAITAPPADLIADTPEGFTS